MDRMSLEAVDSLSNVYAKYFVEDFTHQVINNLGNKISLSDEDKTQFVNSLVDKKLNDVSLSKDGINTVTRFVNECAAYAVDHEVKDPSARETYNQIRDLPSLHHEELNSLAYNSASLYMNTVDKTLLGVIYNDVKTAAGTIVNGAQARMTSEETGGRIKTFNWGVLSDGLWLNSALTTAYSIASIFRPGDEIKAYYAEVGFNFARNRINSPITSNIDESFNLLLAHTDEEILNLLGEASDTRPDLKSLLFKPGSMSMCINVWEKGITRPRILIDSVEHMSQLATVLPHLISVAKNLNEQDLIGEDIVNRIENINTAVTLCLTGYEAVRETSYAESLIMYVSGEGEDPMVDIYVNQDTIRQYTASGGDENDLISFGSYLDPRKGIPTGKGGWSVPWAISQRDNILSEITASESERLQKLRRNDANVIQGLVKDTLGSVVSSYAQAYNLEQIPNRIKNKVNDIARKITSPVAIESFSLEGDIVDLITDVVGDQFVNEVSDRFSKRLSEHHEVSLVRDMTIIETAFDDAVKYVTVN